MPSTAVVLTHVSFSWPDGTSVLDRVSGVFTTGSTGLIGANGAGKSTLLRLVAGRLTPVSGSIAVSGTVDLLPQDVTAGGGTVADLLGISTVRAAIAAIERGETDPRHFDIADWEIDARATAELAAAGLPVELDRPAATLSGGEAMLAALVGMRLRSADIALLDEPTNNLDLDTRLRLYHLIENWRGTLIVVSHDVALLDRMGQTCELRDGSVTSFGGPYHAYREWLDARQEAAEQALRTAEGQLRAERRERIKAEERIAHSQRKGRVDALNRRFIPAVVHERRSSAEKSAGALRTGADTKVAAARTRVEEAERALRDDDTVAITLPDPALPCGRYVVTLPSADGRDRIVTGPQRIGLIGGNGVGKTTLLRTILPDVTVPVGYLPQRIELADGATVLEIARSAAPHRPPGEVRALLAQVLLRGDAVHRPVAALSGGERFRLALARLLLADPIPQLLVLDEPTNNLDLDSQNALVAALSAYRGALLLVSHDYAFLTRLDLDEVLLLSADRVLTPTDLPASGANG